MNFVTGVCCLLLLTFTLGAEVKDPCSVNYECDKITETNAFKDCVQNRRLKRQTCPYANSVQPQVVQAIPIVQPSYQNVQPSYQNVQPVQTICNGGGCPPILEQACLGSSCMPQVVTSHNCVNSCTQTCGGYACKDRCEQSCQPPNEFQNSTTIVQKEIREASVTSPNVTTIIKLTNIVNNTNVVNVPTNINNTNVNNLDLGTNTTSQQLLQQTNQKCCLVVQPKVCQKINSTEGGYRCIHRKHHTCGEQCQTATVHAQVRQPCVGPTSQCPPQIAYVPQPQPSCSYQPAWPYVSCGAQNQRPSCSGCYDHYGYGYHNFYGGSPPSCGGCYDDGYNQGPLYRQGPFYQPGFYHAPPVQAPMMQMPMQPNCGGYGCFGNQFVDPVFGFQSYSPYSSGMYYAPPVQQSYYQMPYYPPPAQYYPQNAYQSYVGSSYYTDFNNTSNSTSENDNSLVNSTQVEIIPLPWGQPSQGMYPYAPMPLPAPYPAQVPAPYASPYLNPYSMGPISYPPMVPYNQVGEVPWNSTKDINRQL